MNKDRSLAEAISSSHSTNNHHVCSQQPGQSSIAKKTNRTMEPEKQVIVKLFGMYKYIETVITIKIVVHVIC
jgi:hypothetical protein